MVVDANITGKAKTYGSYIAFEFEYAKKVVLESLKKTRKIKQFPLEKKRCKYYPIHCTRLGHTTSAKEGFGMYTTSTAEKKATIDDMEEQLINV